MVQIDNRGISAFIVHHRYHIENHPTLNVSYLDFYHCDDIVFTYSNDQYYLV